MAKSTKKLADADGERQGYVPGAPGIYEPFLVHEAGDEGARAAYEYQNMAEGRITSSDAPSEKFVSYAGDIKQVPEGEDPASGD